MEEIKRYNVATLAEFYQALDCVNEDFRMEGEAESGENEGIARLWFRGHSQNYYSLIPSLYRGKFYKKANNNYAKTTRAGMSAYTQMNLKEDYRYQHIKARAFHNVASDPEYQSEWQEIYQHHFGHTRLMDWSESARTALSFALEPFIDTRNNKDLEYRRHHLTPCVWILHPYRLNKKVYDYMAEKVGLLYKAGIASYDKKIRWNDICQALKDNKEIFFDGKDGDIEIKGLISLCAIEDYRKNLGSKLEDAVKAFEFNPFYYLALRVYSDALPFEIQDPEMEILPPIALLHPYHSSRIRTQRGAFTMFPNYVVKGKAEQMCIKRHKDIRNMDEQPYISDCLKVIYIINPNQVAKELMLSGERRSELYPDIQTYADIIETQKYYF